jgi:hypothetical protein
MHNQLSMPKPNHVSVEITAQFGSPFQERVSMGTLTKTLQAWIEFCHSNHSKNVIDFRITNVESPTKKRRAPPSPSGSRV